MDYEGVVIEESLEDKSVLGDLEILSTKISKVTPKHDTPWLKQWTMHTVKVPSSKADAIADSLSKSLDENDWYADYKNNATHYIIFRDKVFKVDRTKPEEYQAATDYGIAHSIPDYQVDFSSFVIM